MSLLSTASSSSHRPRPTNPTHPFNPATSHPAFVQSHFNASSNPLPPSGAPYIQKRIYSTVQTCGPGPQIGHKMDAASEATGAAGPGTKDDWGDVKRFHPAWQGFGRGPGAQRVQGEDEQTSGSGKARL